MKDAWDSEGSWVVEKYCRVFLAGHRMGATCMDDFELEVELGRV